MNASPWNSRLPEWLADRTGVAHAQTRTRTLCGQRALDARYAWPSDFRCPDCEANIGAISGPGVRAPDPDQSMTVREVRRKMTRTVDSERQRQVFERLEGLMSPEDVALALGVSPSTLRTLDIPHVKLTRSSRVYFPDEVVVWLRAQERA
jgi:hypothetical protein